MWSRLAPSRAILSPEAALVDCSGAQRRDQVAWVCQGEGRDQLGEAGACSLQTVINEELAWAAGPALFCNAALTRRPGERGNLLSCRSCCLFVCCGGIPYPHPRSPALEYLWLNPMGRPIKGESYQTVVRNRIKAGRKTNMTKVKEDFQLPWAGKRTSESSGHDSLWFVCLIFF